MMTPREFAARHGITRQRVYELLYANRIAGAEYFKPASGRAKSKRGFWGIEDGAAITPARKPWDDHYAVDWYCANGHGWKVVAKGVRCPICGKTEREKS